MTPDRPDSPVWRRVLMGIARVLATAVVAVAASAALAELEITPIEFGRALPVVLTGEAIVYVLMLGGGAVAGPVMLLTIVLAFAARAGIAIGASALSPQEGGDLIAGAKFYYAAYWPSAVAQVLFMAVLLRLIRPLIARRRRRRRASPRPSPADEVIDDTTREALLAALEESPDAPPASPTVLEEQQLGDLGEQVEADIEEELPAQELALPLDEPEPAEEGPLPPGVIDATPEAPAAEAPEAAEEPADAETAADPAEPEPGPASEAEPAAAEAAEQPVAATPLPGESTDRLEPVGAAEEAGEPAPDEPAGPPVPARNLQEMAAVIADAAGGGADVRVWGASDGRTVIAAVPSGTPAAGTAAHADALARTHVSLCAWLGVDATCLQLTGTPLGAFALRALDESAGVLLLLAGRGEAAAGRLELTMNRTAEAVQGLAPVAGFSAPPALPEMAPLREHRALAGRVADAARAVGGHLARGWRGYRTADGRPVLVTTPAGVDGEVLGRIATAAAECVASFTDALALDRPSWLTVTGGSTVLALGWERIADEDTLLVAVCEDSGGVGRVRWELSAIAQRARAEG